MGRRLRLLCEANPMAYGSSSALLSILDHLDADVTALVRDVTGEMLGRDPAIGRAVTVDVKDPAAVASALEGLTADAVLVVSNLANVAAYHARGIPVFFVDILYWYSAQKRHPVWDLAERTYAQAFPGVAERLREERHARPPTVVGPLIRPVPSVAREHVGTLVNLGGVRSRFIDANDASPFLALICSVLGAVQPQLPQGPLTVAAGEDAARHARSWGLPAVDARSLAQREYLERLGEAALVLTAPGLNAVFEALEAERPMVFLPPQNATQVLQLARYEDAGLVPRGLNLTELVPALDRVERVADEGAYTRAVLEALGTVTRSPSLVRWVVAHVTRQIEGVHDPARVGARAAFRASLGPLGGPTIARDIERWWSAR